MSFIHEFEPRELAAKLTHENCPRNTQDLNCLAHSLRTAYDQFIIRLVYLCSRFKPIVEKEDKFGRDFIW